MQNQPKNFPRTDPQIDPSTDPSLAWAAGLFEGEGCIDISHRRNRRTGKVRLRIQMTDPDVLERMRRVCGGSTRGPFRLEREGCKPMYAWDLYKQGEIALLLELWLPFLGERRRERASQALSELYTPRAYGGWQSEN